MVSVDGSRFVGPRRKIVAAATVGLEAMDASGEVATTASV